MVNSNQSDPHNAASINNPATPQSGTEGGGLSVQSSLQDLGDLAKHSKRLAPGTVLSGGRYTIEKAVASGGMGAVYRAVDTRFNRPCAVKEMLDEYHTDSERTQAVDWFEREATLLLDLNHPCIPRVRDFFVEGNKHYLVMDFIEGMTLGDMLEKEGNIIGVNGARGVTEASARSWGQQICNVLIYLHNQTPPIIFRDLKPSNIMVTPRGDIKLIDFGIARNFQPQSQSTIIMTVGYAPLEQVAGNAEPRSDLYALGATLHRILTHHDAANNRPDIFTFPPARLLRPDVSPAFEQVIMRALAPLNMRWPNAGEMERAIINLPRITITPPVAPGGGMPGQPRPANPLTPANSMARSAPITPAAIPSNSTTGPAGASILAALEFIGANRIEEAYAAVQQAFVLEPNNSLVHRIFGQVFARRRPPLTEQATQAYTKSLQLNPNDSETHKLLGDVSLFLRKQPLPAIPAYIQSLRLNPNDVEAHQRLAQSYEETNQPEPALREYQEAARLAPQQPALHVKVGQLAMRLNQLPLAERAFITVLRLHPEDYQIRYLLSQVYENEGKLNDAERECSYVIRFVPAAQPMLSRLRGRLGK
jgi:serine/threonine protein kinase